MDKRKLLFHLRECRESLFSAVGDMYDEPSEIEDQDLRAVAVHLDAAIEVAEDG